jgi:hypothetical protein
MSAALTPLAAPGVAQADSTTSWATQARFDGVLALHWLPTALAEQWLLPGLRLGGPGGTHRHPALLLFGGYEKGGPIWGGFQLPLGFSYRELLVVLPWLEAPGVTEPVCQPVLGFADHSIPSWFGNEHYGIPKHHGPCEWDGENFLCAGVQAMVRATGPRVHGHIHQDRSLSQLTEMITAPWYGLTKQGAPVRCEHEWDLTEAHVQLARVVAQARPETGLPATWTAEPDASFLLSGSRWRISYPQR